MKQNIKIAIIGGTGKSGKYLVRLLASQGFHFKILLRNPENHHITSASAEIVKGDVRDYEAVRLLVEGCQAVMSTLGQPKGEPPIFSQATKNVIRAMNACNIQRYILTTGLNVDTSSDKKSAKTQAATDWMKTNYPETTLDKQAELQVLSDSNIDWTLVRLPFIEQTDARRNVRVDLEDCPGDTISATDLAHFLVDLLSNELYRRKSPFIANV